MNRPKFGKYFTDDWPYESYQGVGLELIGAPNDSKSFIDLLQEESCNPLATRRILEDLEKYGHRKTTVMSVLNFEYIGDELKKLGVTMKIIVPLEPAWRTEVDSAAFSLIKGEKIDESYFSSEEMKEINKRILDAKQSFEQLIHNFGPYEPNFDISNMLEKRRKKGI